MDKYCVFVSGRVSKIYEIESDSKEAAMIEALDYFNEYATEEFNNMNILSEVYVDANELPNEEKATEK